MKSPPTEIVLGGVAGARRPLASGCLLVVAAASIMAAEPQLEIRIDPPSGHAALVPFALLISLTWQDDEDVPRFPRLTARPDSEDLRLDGSSVRNSGSKRIDFVLSYLPERQGRFDLEPIAVTYQDRDGTDREIQATPLSIDVGPAPLPWWRGPALIWAGLGTLGVAIAASFVAVIVKVRRGRVADGPAASQKPERKRVPPAERLLEARRLRHEGDVPGFAAAVERALAQSIIEHGGRPASADASHGPLTDLLPSLPDGTQERARELVGVCEEFRYARPHVSPQEMETVLQDAERILEELEPISPRREA